MRIMVVDPAAELLDPSLDQPESPIERAVHLMAISSAMRYQLDPDLRAFVLTTPDLGVPDPDVVVELQRLVADHPDYSFQPLSAIPGITNSFFVSGQALTVTLDPRPAVSLELRVRRVNAARLRVADVASMLPTDDQRPSEWEADLRTALSTGITAIRSAATHRRGRSRSGTHPRRGSPT